MFEKNCVSSWWFQPIWKICSSNWIISPRIGVKIKNNRNHHLVHHGIWYFPQKTLKVDEWCVWNPYMLNDIDIDVYCGLLSLQLQKQGRKFREWSLLSPTPGAKRPCAYKRCHEADGKHQNSLKKLGIKLWKINQVPDIFVFFTVVVLTKMSDQFFGFSKRLLQIGSGISCKGQGNQNFPSLGVMAKQARWSHHIPGLVGRLPSLTRVSRFQPAPWGTRRCTVTCSWYDMLCTI